MRSFFETSVIGKVQDYRHSRRYAQIGISDEQKRSGKCTAAESGKLNKLFPADVKTLFPDKAIKKRKQACNAHAVQHNAFIRHFA